ncbi:MAG: HPr family phosphocarrier protein [Spirochaetales bacterium]|nr:HPr family phosphocarrier protein [Spirochaetales bacterium]
MIRKSFTIPNRAGFHGRTAALFVRAIYAFKSTILLIRDNMVINGKSIMSILSLGASYNTMVDVIADGEDEKNAMEAIEQLFMNRFEE